MRQCNRGARLRARVVRMWPVVLAPILAALVLAGCGATAGLPDAATVLRQAQEAKITDLTFTATGMFASSLGPVLTGAGGSDLAFQATVSGRLTTSPQRADLALALGQDRQAVLEVITDAATQTGYVRLALLDQIGIGGNLWIRVPLDGLASYLDPSLFTNFEHLTKPTLVGAETLRSTAVYHLHGAQQLQTGIGTASEDFYVRQDNAFPERVGIQGAVKVPALVSIVSGTGGQASVQATIDFTAVNTGATIALPPSDEIIAG